MQAVVEGMQKEAAARSKSGAGGNEIQNGSIPVAAGLLPLIISDYFQSLTTTASPADVLPV